MSVDERPKHPRISRPTRLAFLVIALLLSACRQETGAGDPGVIVPPPPPYKNAVWVGREDNTQSSIVWDARPGIAEPRYYLYSTANDGPDTDDARILSSSNLTEWEVTGSEWIPGVSKEGPCSGDPHGKQHALTDVVYFGDRFFVTYKYKGRQICLASSTNPTGPFVPLAQLNANDTNVDAGVFHVRRLDAAGKPCSVEKACAEEQLWFVYLHVAGDDGEHPCCEPDWEYKLKMRRIEFTPGKVDEPIAWSADDPSIYLLNAAPYPINPDAQGWESADVSCRDGAKLRKLEAQRFYELGGRYWLFYDANSQFSPFGAIGYARCQMGAFTTGNATPLCQRAETREDKQRWPCTSVSLTVRPPPGTFWGLPPSASDRGRNPIASTIASTNAADPNADQWLFRVGGPVTLAVVRDGPYRPDPATGKGWAIYLGDRCGIGLGHACPSTWDDRAWQQRTEAIFLNEVYMEPKTGDAWMQYRLYSPPKTILGPSSNLDVVAP